MMDEYLLEIEQTTIDKLKAQIAEQQAEIRHLHLVIEEYKKIVEQRKGYARSKIND